MELDDCAFPLLARDRHHRRPEAARSTARTSALLVGARPRTQGHGARRPARGQRRHLQAAGRGDQRRRRRRHQGPRGRQPGEHQRADRAVERARRPARALHRDDAPRPQPRDRAARQKIGAAGRRRHQHDRSGATTRPTQYPDLVQREGGGRARRRSAVDDEAWIADEFIPTVGKRGAAIIEARGASSSAASAANAAIDHVHDWVLGTPEGDWVSMARPVRRLLRRRPRASSARSRAPARAASGRSSRASRSTTSPAQRIDASVAELGPSATRSPSSGSSEPGRGPR